MSADALAALLRLKRIRESRAAAALAEATRALDTAAAAQDGAARAVRAFGVLRKAQESGIYRRLAETEISSGRLMAATGNLSDLAAREGALRDEVREAERRLRERQRLAEAARTEWRQRQRRAESLDALGQALRKDAQAEAERGAERAAEEQGAPPVRRPDAPRRRA